MVLNKFKIKCAPRLVAMTPNNKAWVSTEGSVELMVKDSKVFTEADSTRDWRGGVGAV